MEKDNTKDKDGEIKKEESMVYERGEYAKNQFWEDRFKT